MKKTINSFLYVGRIIAIVAIVITSIILTVRLVFDTVALFDQSVELHQRIINLISNLFSLSFTVLSSIVSLILNYYSSLYFQQAKNHEEGIKPGVLGIVSGALVMFAPFSAVAGILMLVSKDDVFSDVIDMTNDNIEHE